MNEIRINNKKAHYFCIETTGDRSSNYIKINQILSSFFNKTVMVKKDNFGKPFISMVNNKLLPLSISHSKSVLLVVFSEDYSILIGADYEAKKVKDTVLKRVTSKGELEYIQNNSILNEDVWMQKEAISKALGSGLSMGFQNIDISKKRLGEYTVAIEKIQYGNSNFYVSFLT